MTFGIDKGFLDAQPQITPLFRQCNITPDRVMEVLSGDLDEYSQAIVRSWNEMTPAERQILGLEAVAVHAGVTPRRLWELYAGATMTQSRESAGVMIADALPAILRVTIKQAKTPKGFTSREHILKSARVLPVPKGSTTNINVGAPNELPEPSEEEGGLLEGADNFLMKASRAMGSKVPQLLPPQEDE